MKGDYSISLGFFFFFGGKVEWKPSTLSKEREFEIKFYSFKL